MRVRVRVRVKVRATIRVGVRVKVRGEGQSGGEGEGQGRPCPRPTLLLLLTWCWLERVSDAISLYSSLSPKQRTETIISRAASATCSRRGWAWPEVVFVPFVCGAHVISSIEEQPKKRGGKKKRVAQSHARKMASSTRAR